MNEEFDPAVNPAPEAEAAAVQETAAVSEAMQDAAQETAPVSEAMQAAAQETAAAAEAAAEAAAPAVREAARAVEEAPAPAPAPAEPAPAPVAAQPAPAPAAEPAPAAPVYQAPVQASPVYQAAAAPYAQPPQQQAAQPVYPYAAAPVQTIPTQDSRPPKKSPYAPMSSIGMAVQLFLMGIPVIGLILSIIWSCGVCRKIARRNLARACLILLILGIVAAIVGALLIRFVFQSEFTDLFERLVPGYTIQWG